METTIPGIEKLRDTLRCQKAKHFMNVDEDRSYTILWMRTPLTLGQELSGYAAQI
jgi:fumarate hydratase class II